ncbi:hypothetical protein LZ016_06500 [Sphingomonas sp. SM33]|uniref:DUF2306 domain-containing protein n=1 Tax=Sphingomonas telluris TaxID=2907998 RepID=A0ABS9VL99_9SPHN|nr:hypothetical protein [Sphingomonas telluris]MCH8615749.1 hypothetical protein [Sphingomonas telluris]
MATIASQPIDAQTRERRFYCRMALFLVAVVFIGFAPSFYLKDIVPPYPRPNPTLPPAVILHGLAFTLWMLAFVAQTQLVAAGRRDVHMKMGIATVVLAALLVPIMYVTAVWGVARESHPPFTDGLNWTAIPLGVIPAFAYLVYEAWRKRREAPWHKRLMLGATILVVFGPGFSRIPLSPPTFWGFTIQLIAGMCLLFAPLFVWDRRTLGKVHPATWHAFIASALAVIIPLTLIATRTWAPIAEHLPGVGT